MSVFIPGYLEYFDPEYCAESVHDKDRSVGYHQCGRVGRLEFEGHRYCKQHYPPSASLRSASARRCICHAVLKKHENGLYCMRCRDYAARVLRDKKVEAFEAIARLVNSSRINELWKIKPIVERVERRIARNNPVKSRSKKAKP